MEAHSSQCNTARTPFSPCLYIRTRALWLDLRVLSQDHVFYAPHTSWQWYAAGTMRMCRGSVSGKKGLAKLRRRFASASRGPAGPCGASRGYKRLVEARGRFVTPRGAPRSLAGFQGSISVCCPCLSRGRRSRQSALGTQTEPWRALPESLAPSRTGPMAPEFDRRPSTGGGSGCSRASLHDDPWSRCALHRIQDIVDNADHRSASIFSGRP